MPRQAKPSRDIRRQFPHAACFFALDGPWPTDSLRCLIEVAVRQPSPSCKPFHRNEPTCIYKNNKMSEAYMPSSVWATIMWFNLLESEMRYKPTPGWQAQQIHEVHVCTSCGSCNKRAAAPTKKTSRVRCAAIPESRHFRIQLIGKHAP